MLRFMPHVFCHVFRLEIALVLHHASVWSEVVNVGVRVNALNDMEHSPHALPGWDLAVELGARDDEPLALQQLAGYLLRLLGVDYDVTIEGDRLLVVWDTRRRPSAVTTPIEASAASASGTCAAPR